ncbi:MAG: class I tRNA ligase family protein, partial [Pseudomonadota bacterium]
DQWFVKADVLAKPAVEAVRDGRTTILPKQDEKVYFNWLENIEPWCISRQLWWGHQIPVWYDEDGAQYCAMTEAEAQAQAGDKTLTRDEDVLDTWFSSGLWPIGTLGWPDNTPELQKYFPTNTLVTGFDIIFFWVARMMMMQLEMKGEVPFSTVYVHALVRDEKGKKMSKSLGNVLDPLDLIDQYGADAVRFTLTAMAAMGRDLKLSTDRIAGYRNFGTKLWNAARFAEMNDCFAQYDPRMSEDGLAFDQISAPANRWIVGETARVRETIDAALAAYRFNDAASAAYTHVWNRFCDWYVEFAKPLLADEATKAETQQVMAWALDQCLILLHPMMPFITEQLWGDLTKRGGMLVHGQWPTYAAADLADADADAELGWVITLIESIRSIRTELRVPAGAKIPLIQLELDAAGTGALQRNLALVERLARVPGIERAQTAPKGAVTLPVKGGVFCLPLAEHIDLEAETARLDKATQKLDKELGGLRAKLGNEKFLAGAPEAVVADQKTRLSEAEDEMEKLRAAKARLAELA